MKEVKWYIKFWNAIKSLFKKFEFDNKLFGLGVDWAVSETLKRVGSGYVGNSVDGLVKNFANVLDEKFKRFPQITKLIDDSSKEIIKTIESKRGYAQMKLENKIKFIGEAAKSWYNKNL